MEGASTQGFLTAPSLPIQATGLILAGGRSRRMGHDKARLPLGDTTLLDHLVGLLQAVFDEVIVASGESGAALPAGIREVHDTCPGEGPLSGIHAGLSAAAHPCVFVTACDMPFFNAGLASFLVDRVRGADIAVPKRGEFLEPLFAVYEKSCLPFIEQALKRGRKKVSSFFDQVKAVYIEEEDIRRFDDPERVFFNTNTLKDYRSLLQSSDIRSCKNRTG